MSQSELLQLNKMFSRKPESYWNDLIKKEKEIKLINVEEDAIKEMY